MDEDQAALHLAHLLESTPWHGLPSTALLRLLNILCYDIAQASWGWGGEALMWGGGVRNLGWRGERKGGPSQTAGSMGLDHGCMATGVDASVLLLPCCFSATPCAACRATRCATTSTRGCRTSLRSHLSATGSTQRSARPSER